MPEEDGTAPLDRVAVVIPCFNAGPRIAPVVAVARALSPQLPVFVVDDGSTDGATGPLDTLGATVLRDPVNRGKGHALVRGFRAALAVPGVQCVATIDADGQHDPAALPALVAAFEETGADLLIGARQLDGSGVPWASRLGNGVTSALAARLLPGCPRDTQSGYRLHRRALLEGLMPRLHPGRYETEMELLIGALRGGFRVAEHPIATHYEPGNASSHFRKLRDSARIYRRLVTSLLIPHKKVPKWD